MQPLDGDGPVLAYLKYITLIMIEGINQIPRVYALIIIKAILFPF